MPRTWKISSQVADAGWEVWLTRMTCGEPTPPGPESEGVGEQGWELLALGTGWSPGQTLSRDKAGAGSEAGLWSSHSER